MSLGRTMQIELLRWCIERWTYRQGIGIFEFLDFEITVRIKIIFHHLKMSTWKSKCKLLHFLIFPACLLIFIYWTARVLQCFATDSQLSRYLTRHCSKKSQNSSRRRQKSKDDSDDDSDEEKKSARYTYCVQVIIKIIIKTYRTFYRLLHTYSTMHSFYEVITFLPALVISTEVSIWAMSGT